jgi:hypothetical protein
MTAMGQYGCAVRSVLAAVAALSTLPASGASWELDWGPGFDLAWKNKLAAGAQWRLESPRTSFIGKSNLDPDLCAPDACISLRRQPRAAPALDGGAGCGLANRRRGQSDA